MSKKKKTSAHTKDVVTAVLMSAGIAMMIIATIIEPIGYIPPLHMMIGFIGGVMLMLGVGLLAGDKW